MIDFSPPLPLPSHTYACMHTHTQTHTSSEQVVAGYTGASLLLTQWLPSWLPQAVACVSVESGASRGSVTVLTEGGDQSYELEGGESLGTLRYRRLPSWGASCPTAATRVPGQDDLSFSFFQINRPLATDAEEAAGTVAPTYKLIQPVMGLPPLAWGRRHYRE